MSSKPFAFVGAFRAHACADGDGGCCAPPVAENPDGWPLWPGWGKAIEPPGTKTKDRQWYWHPKHKCVVVSTAAQGNAVRRRVTVIQSVIVEPAP